LCEEPEAVVTTFFKNLDRFIYLMNRFIVNRFKWTRIRMNRFKRKIFMNAHI